MTFNKWSKTAASNATADSTIDWAEGQSPASVNDSGRAMMAAAAKYRDDVSGSITTGGTSTAYTVASNQSFASLSALSGNKVAFVPHATNGADATLNVDGLGAKYLRQAPGVSLQAGVLIQGTPYLATYFSGTNEFILHGVFNPYSLPIGGTMFYLGATAPSSSFVFPYGQAISRTTYATLFGIVGTTFGTGDGSTTFNIPDIRGRVIAGIDNMGGTSANRLTGLSGGVDGDVTGAVGGAESVTLDVTMIPSHGHSASSVVTDPSHTHFDGSAQNVSGPGGGLIGAGNTSQRSTSASVTGISVSTTISNTGGGLSHNNIQPTIILPVIVRVI